jgi:alpha-L-fucosidase
MMPPPPPPRPSPLRKEGKTLADLCEASPVIWQGGLAILECVRPASGGKREDYYLRLSDPGGNRELARLATGYSLASAFAFKTNLYVFASRFEPDSWNDVTVFKSNDLRTWQSAVAIHQTNEHLFNSSVCADDRRFVMAYESDDAKYRPFTVKFAVSQDLEQWTKLPDVFGADRYTACPTLRYADGWYYLLYLEHRTPRWFFETWLARSRDLKSWELSPVNPVISPGPDEGINASDPDIVEAGGQTIVYYSVGDQRTWSRLKRAFFPGTMSEFFQSCFPAQRQ